MNDILGSVSGLRAIPATVLKITAMITSNTASSAELEQVIRHDEALSMAVLRAANSVRFGRPGKSFTLREGITRLGMRTLRQIILEQQTMGMFANAGAAFDLQRGALWRSAVGGALAAELLAKRARSDEGDVCFVCSLLRDVGKLAFDARFRGDYLRQVTPHIRPDRTFLEAEREAFGFDHAQLGAELARRWRLPDRIVESIAFHHDPPSSPDARDTLYDIVHASDIITLWAGLAVGVDGLQYRLAEHVRTGLDLELHTTERMIAEIWTGVHEAESMVGGMRSAGVAA